MIPFASLTPVRSFGFKILACLFLIVAAAGAFAAAGKQPQKTGTTPAPEVPEQVDKVAEVQVKSALKVLQEGRPGVIYLIIRNISNVPIKVQDVILTPDNKNFIQASSADLERGKELLPQQAQKLEVLVSANGQIEEGSHLLLVEVAIEWKKNDKPLTGRLFASQDFSVEVLGASGILSVLGVSSILFLPGFLGVTGFIVLKRLSQKYSAGEKWELDLKSPEFWMMALIASVPAVLLYPRLSKWWFGEARNYLKGYGLSDVALLGIASIGVGLGVGITYKAVTGGFGLMLKKYQSQIESYAESLEPMPTDTPPQLLDKLARRWDWMSRSRWRQLRLVQRLPPNGDPLPLEPNGPSFSKGYPKYVEVSERVLAGAVAAGQPVQPALRGESYFLVGPLEKGVSQQLVVPPITYKYIASPDVSQTAAYRQFRTDLDLQIRNRGGRLTPYDVGRIAALFNQGVSAQWLEVNWGATAADEEKFPHSADEEQLIYRPNKLVRFFSQEQT